MIKEQAIIGNSLARAQLAGTLLDNQAKEIENAWLPKEKQQEYDIKCATLFQMYLNGLKTEAEIKKIFADTALTYAKVATEGKQQKLLDEKIETENLNQVGIDQQNQIRAVDVPTAEQAKQFGEAKFEALVSAYELETTSNQLQHHKTSKEYGARTAPWYTGSFIWDVRDVVDTWSDSINLFRFK